MILFTTLGMEVGIGDLGHHLVRNRTVWKHIMSYIYDIMKTKYEEEIAIQQIHQRQ